MQNTFVIVQASIIDGTGAPAYCADVEIIGDRIGRIAPRIAVGNTPVIDGNGLTLAPGFIDVHTHDDLAVIKQPDCLAKLSQGVTTVIVGNCGISASPSVLNSEPPDPMNLLGNRCDFQYPTFARYAQAVTQAKPAVNVAALIGHTTLRNNVMDDLYRPAKSVEIHAMRQALRQAMQQGALGLSTGLAYASAFDSPPEEVLALATELVDYSGLYTTHLRSEFDPIIDAMKEAFAVGKTHQIPVMISHLKCAGAGNWGRMGEILNLMDRTSQVQDVSCDCYPYHASASTLDLKQVTDDFTINITWSEPHPEHAQKTLKTIAEEMGLSLLETAKALQPAGAIYHGMHPDDVVKALCSVHSMIGSDGLPNDPYPHPRLWGTFPRVLGHYSRDQGHLPLTQAVHKMTGKSAQRFRLKDRGVIRQGAYADLVLFHADTISDTATFEAPEQPAQGIMQVFVNGQPSYQPGAVTEHRCGRFLYRDTAVQVDNNSLDNKEA